VLGGLGLACSAVRTVAFFAPAPGAGVAARGPALSRRHGWHPGAEPVEEEGEKEKVGHTGEIAYFDRWRDVQIQDMLRSNDIRYSTVNDILEPNYLEQKHYVIRPDEAFGCIFMLDVVTDVGTGLLQPTWARVAEEYGLPVRDAVTCQRSLGAPVPEVGITRFMNWTTDYSQARQVLPLSSHIFLGLLRLTRAAHPSVFIHQKVRSGLPFHGEGRGRGI
jgi:hypothetical protein